MTKKHVTYRLFYFASIMAAGVSTLLGVMVLIGWYTHNVNFVQVLPAFVPMQYNTAMGFVLCGLGILFHTFSFKRSTLICAGTVGAIGFLTLLQYLFGVNFRIDQLFMEHYITVETSHPGRMAPNTALCFFLSGIALIVLNVFNKFCHHHLVTGSLGAIIVGLGVVAFSGYLSGVETAYGWGNLTRMAIHTAAGFVAVGIALFSIAWYEEISEDKVTPFNLPAFFVGIAVSTISVTLWQALQAQILLEQSHFVINLVLILGLLMALLFVLAILFGQKYRHHAKTIAQINKEIKKEIVERKQVEKERENLIEKLQGALAEIKSLKGILPICSYCKKVRDDKGYWEQVDVYIQKHSEADISHSICQECMKIHNPEEHEAIYSKEK